MPTFRSKALPGILVVLALPTAPASGQTPTVADGQQFLVNSYTADNQTSPAVAVDAEGNFVVVWDSMGSVGSDTSGYSVQGQRYAANGDAVGAQFQVNTYTPDYQSTPSVAVDADGDFVVVWDSYGSDNGDTAGYSVQGQRYGSNGAPVGGQFRVNSYTLDYQTFPAVAAAPAGDFVVVWQSYGSDDGDTSGYSVQGQRYAANGDLVGAQFQVNTYTTANQGFASVAVDEDGDFVVVWDSGADAGDTSGYSVQGQRYASNGNPVGGQFLVNSYTADDQGLPSVAAEGGGDFVVVWQSYGSDGGDTSAYSVQGQRYASNGAVAGGQFQVNTYTPGNQGFTSVTVDAAGDFVVAWESYGSDGGDTSDFSIQVQRYASNGDAVGGQFQVNTFTAGDQFLVSVAAAPYGDFVVAWQSAGSDNGDASGFSVQGQRFRVTADLGDLVFLDADFDGLQSVAEPGIEGVPVDLFEDGGGLLASTETDADGGFLFRPKIGLHGVADHFYLKFEAPARYSFTAADVGGDDTLDSDADPVFGETETIEILSAGETHADVDAGLTNGVGDRVWLDADGDGLQDGSEAGVAGVTVRLLTGGGGEVGSTVTDADGGYAFADLSPGTYYLEFTAPAGLVFTAQNQGGDDALDSDVDETHGDTPPFAFANGDVVLTWDAGLVPEPDVSAQVGDRVWLDANQNGVQNGGEVGIAGVTVNLYREPDPPFPTLAAATLEATDVTDGDGFYSFTVAPGTYYLEFVCSAESFTPLDQGADDAVDSDVEPSTATTSPFVLGEGAADATRDAGLIDPDGDGVVCQDNCPLDANADQLDVDGDGAGDVCDLCQGDDATGDGDGDGICADRDCDDGDPANACAVFSDGFESGDVSAWS